MATRPIERLTSAVFGSAQIFAPTTQAYESDLYSGTG
jgi:hypothetical protein